MSASTYTIPLWSLIPGMVFSLRMRDSLLVINRSNVFSPRVGSVSNWARLLSLSTSTNGLVMSGW